MIFSKPLALSLVFACAIMACDTEETTLDVTSYDLSTELTARALGLLDDTEWLFTNYSKNPISTRYENRISLSFGVTSNESLSYSGSSLINAYGGTFTVKEGTGLLLENNDGVTTLAGSLNQEDAEIENRYFSTISEATFFEVKDATLRIYLGDTSDTATEILNFQKK